MARMYLKLLAESNIQNPLCPTSARLNRKKKPESFEEVSRLLQSFEIGFCELQNRIKSQASFEWTLKNEILRVTHRPRQSNPECHGPGSGFRIGRIRQSTRGNAIRRKYRQHVGLHIGRMGRPERTLGEPYNSYLEETLGGHLWCEAKRK